MALAQNIDKISELPNEILLRIFEDLDLQALIASRCVNQLWRTLVPSAKMGDVRKSMFDFYFDLLASSTFHDTRAWVKANLKPFDRKKYISKLLSQYPSLPEDFRIWVLEWPEKAIIGGVWPGLPRRQYSYEFSDNVNIIPGINWLSYPQVSMMAYVDRLNRIVESIPGIVLWGVPETVTWLIVDERTHMNGKIFHHGMGLYRTILDGSLDDDKLYHPQYDSLTPSWMDYLRQTWINIEKAASDDLAKHRITEDTLTPSEMPDVLDLSIIAWKRRNTSDAASWFDLVQGTHPFNAVI